MPIKAHFKFTIVKMYLFVLLSIFKEIRQCFNNNNNNNNNGSRKKCFFVKEGK